MYLKQVNKILLTSMISICTANVAFASDKTSDITHEVTSYEQSAYGETKGYVLTKSSTGSKMDIDITEIPQSLSVVSSDMMNDRAVQSIQNVTSYTSAVLQSLGENGDTRANYGTLRGISYLYKSSFLDDLKLLWGSHAVPTIDPYSLQRVEILKGPSSVLYGASAPGGLLNMQSKKPNNIASKEIGIQAGSENLKSIFVDINDSINDKVLFRITSKFKSNDSQLDKSSNKSYFVNPSFTFLLNDDTTLDLLLSHTYNETKGLGVSYSGAKSIFNYHNEIAKNAAGIKQYINLMATKPGYGALAPLAAMPTSAYVQYLENAASKINAANLKSSMMVGLPNDEKLEKTADSISLVLNHTINENTKIKSKIRYMKIDSTFNNTQPNSNGILDLLTMQKKVWEFPLAFHERSIKLDSFAMDNNIEYSWNTKSTENISLFGLDYQYFKYNNQAKNAVNYSFDILNPDYSQTITKSTQNRYDTDFKTEQIGLYASNQMKINDKIIISSALRYDILKDKVTFNIANPKNKNRDVSENNISGRLGLAYLFDNGISPYISYATSFQANTGIDKNFNTFSPSIGEQIEVGAKYKPKNMNALFTFAAYKIIQKDSLQKDPTDNAFMVQSGDTEVKGIEFDITSKPNENSNLTFSLSRTSGKEINMANKKHEGRKLGNLPELAASIWSDYTFNKTAVGDLKLGLGIKYTGKSKFLQGDYFNFGEGRPEKLFDVDSYTMVDALISTKYNKWNIALNVNNVFDKKARLSNNAIQSAQTQGRTYALSASYKF